MSLSQEIWRLEVTLKLARIWELVLTVLAKETKDLEDEADWVDPWDGLFLRAMRLPF